MIHVENSSLWPSVEDYRNGRIPEPFDALSLVAEHIVVVLHQEPSGRETRDVTVQMVTGVVISGLVRERQWAKI